MGLVHSTKWNEIKKLNDERKSLCDHTRFGAESLMELIIFDKQTVIGSRKAQHYPI